MITEGQAVRLTVRIGQYICPQRTKKHSTHTTPYDEEMCMIDNCGMGCFFFYIPLHNRNYLYIKKHTLYNG